MNINDVFKDFCKNIKKRKGIMTEDNIRYYWFASMLKKDKDLNHYTLEYPYKEAEVDGLSKEELDLFYEGDNEIWCFEMKFHRKGELKSEYAHTGAAGALFNDLLRLQELKLHLGREANNVRYFFLYVTDQEMYDYLTAGEKSNLNKEYRKRLKEFFKLETNKEISLDFEGIDTIPNTFIESALASFVKKEEAMDNKDKILIHNIQLCEKDDTLTCESMSFKGDNKRKPCYVRLYEIL